MLPDKVYLEEECSVPVVGFVSPAWNNPKDKESTAEYIRKEALLDYFRQRIEELNSPLNGVFGSTEREHCSERISELLLLIDKLNEM